jgi:malyl-CoA/(S)-citramalyl-CoA lyase
VTLCHCPHGCCGLCAPSTARLVFFSDTDGYAAQANPTAVLGCEGKWAIHPSQVTLANIIFSPSDKEVTMAKRIMETMERPQKDGQGAVALDGRLIDIASIMQVEVMAKKAWEIAAEA